MASVIVFIAVAPIMTSSWTNNIILNPIDGNNKLNYISRLYHSDRHLERKPNALYIMTVNLAHQTYTIVTSMAIIFASVMTAAENMGQAVKNVAQLPFGPLVLHGADDDDEQEEKDEESESHDDADLNELMGRVNLFILCCWRVAIDRPSRSRGEKGRRKQRKVISNIPLKSATQQVESII